MVSRIVICYPINIDVKRWDGPNPCSLAYTRDKIKRHCSFSQHYSMDIQRKIGSHDTCQHPDPFYRRFFGWHAELYRGRWQLHRLSRIALRATLANSSE